MPLFCNGFEWRESVEMFRENIKSVILYMKICVEHFLYFWQMVGSVVERMWDF